MECEFKYVKIGEFEFKAANIHASKISKAFVKYPRIDIYHITHIKSIDLIKIKGTVTLPPVPSHLEQYSGWEPYGTRKQRRSFNRYIRSMDRDKKLNRKNMRIE